MSADTNTVTNMAIRTRFQDRATKMSLNATALKLTAPTVQVCTKASMPAIRRAFALDLTTISAAGASWVLLIWGSSLLTQFPDQPDKFNQRSETKIRTVDHISYTTCDALMVNRECQLADSLKKEVKMNIEN